MDFFDEDTQRFGDFMQFVFTQPSLMRNESSCVDMWKEERDHCQKQRSCKVSKLVNELRQRILQCVCFFEG